MRAIVLNIILLLFIVSSTNANANNFSRTVWLNETNTPLQVNCLLQDSTGYIWLGTEEGLFRYDGHNATKITTAHATSVTSLSVYGSKLLIGFKNGEIGEWDGYNYQNKKLTGVTPQATISSITPIFNNVYIVSTLGEGIFLMFNGYCTQYTSDSGLSDDYIYSLHKAKNGLFIAITDQGINAISVQQENISIKHYTSKDGLPDNIVTSISNIKHSSWSMVGTHQGGVALYCNKKNKVITPEYEQSWSWGKVTGVKSTNNREAWCCTDKGYLLHLIINDPEHITIEDHFFDGESFQNILIDKVGNIWCGTKTGLKLINLNYLASISVAGNYSLKTVTAITTDNEYVYYAQGSDVYQTSIKGNNSKLFYKAPESVTKLFYDQHNTLWIGTFNNGVYYKELFSAVKKLSNIPILANETILDITGNDNNIWISGLNGVQELNKTKEGYSLRKTHNKASGIGSDYVYQINIDAKDDVWMATDGAGVCMYDGNTYKHWDSSEGMSSDVIYSITSGRDSLIYAATLNNGLLRFNGKQWESINTTDGLSDLILYGVFYKPDGEVCIINNKGVDVWSEESEQFIHYNKRTDIGLDSFSKALNLFTTDSSGNFYIPYQDGIVCFHKKSTERNVIPNINISGISVLLTEMTRNKTEFKYSENHLTFKYEGISYTAGDKLYYRYKLDGYNDDWIYTRDEAVTFPRLSPGTYEFRVQASLNELFTSYNEDNYAFKVYHPFWEQAWFVILLTVVIIIIAIMIIRYRDDNIRVMSALQKERMVFEYEHLKSQVNPHFLFNSLNTLTELIEEDRDAAQKYTEQLSDLYRNMLSHKDKDLIPLSDEWQIIKNYIYIQQSRFGNALKIDIKMPEHIIKSKKIVPMALQLLIENAIKHNIVSNAKPLIISIVAVEDHITVKNNYQPKISKEKGAGLGLVNIKKRYSHTTKAQVTFRIYKDDFIVTIPLL